MQTGGYDFPFVSVGTGEEFGLLEEAPPSGTVVFVDDLYVATGPGFEHGDEVVGSVTIVEWKSPRPGRVPFTAHFSIDSGNEDEPELVVLTGIVPGNGTWRGRGRVAYNGGTGKFDGRSGSLPIASENPKRWG